MASGSTKSRSKQAGEHAPASTRRQSRKRKQDDQIHSETEYPASSPGKGTAKERSSKKVKQNGPYENLLRPTHSECQEARDGLAALHGDPKRAALGEEKFELAQEAAAGTQAAKKESWQRTVMDALVCTILSQNTTDVNSHRAFTKLKARFPEWEDVRTADSADVEESIKSGGLAAIKTERIKAILNTLKDERGECSLEHLRSSTDEEIKTELERFKGVGKKTIACVLMFCLNRHEFPVDTHVWRITKSLGWVPAKATRDEAYAHLNVRIPDELKYDLHVLLVNHGKRCPRCAKNGKPRKASDGDCPLFGKKDIAKSKQDPDNSSDELLKSEEGASDELLKTEEDASAESDVSEGKVDMKHVHANVKQEPHNDSSTGGDVKRDVKHEAEL